MSTPSILGRGNGLGHNPGRSIFVIKYFKFSISHFTLVKQTIPNAQKKFATDLHKQAEMLRNV